MFAFPPLLYSQQNAWGDALTVYLQHIPMLQSFYDRIASAIDKNWMLLLSRALQDSIVLQDTIVAIPSGDQFGQLPKTAA